MHVGFTGRDAAAHAREPAARYGFEPFASRGGVVTNELIDRLRADEPE